MGPNERRAKFEICSPTTASQCLSHRPASRAVRVCVDLGVEGFCDDIGEFLQAVNLCHSGKFEILFNIHFFATCCLMEQTVGRPDPVTAGAANGAVHVVSTINDDDSRVVRYSPVVQNS